MALPWDHENRLTAVETDTDVTEDAYRWRRELIYDGLGRLRIRKDYDWFSGWGWYPVQTTYYLYDGWLLVQERSSPMYPTATYVWARICPERSAVPVASVVCWPEAPATIAPPAPGAPTATTIATAWVMQWP